MWSTASSASPHSPSSLQPYGPASMPRMPLLYEKGSAIRGTKDRFRLSLRERDREFFQTFIQREDGINKLLKLTDGLTDSETSIRTNAALYMERLAKLPEADRLRLAQFV